ncbi:hypothetical protein [Streptomyces sp. NPDC088146]|uniref:hypothetical protein n=1 Tax=Streptomyces sp. NPDC088146 TaxID=3365829 RepID=UPI0037F961B4
MHAGVLGDDRRDSQRNGAISGMNQLMVNRIVLPGYGFLRGYKATRLFKDIQQLFPDGKLEQMRHYGADVGMTARHIDEGLREGWLGEVEGLKVSLTGAEEELTQLDRHPSEPSVVDLGLPVTISPIHRIRNDARVGARSSPVFLGVPTSPKSPREPATPLKHKGDRPLERHPMPRAVVDLGRHASRTLTAAR